MPRVESLDDWGYADLAQLKGSDRHLTPPRPSDDDVGDICGPPATPRGTSPPRGARWPSPTARGFGSARPLSAKERARQLEAQEQRRVLKERAEETSRAKEEEARREIAARLRKSYLLRAKPRTTRRPGLSPSERARVHERLSASTARPKVGAVYC